ncbi:hypothetical protein L211DRAFT_838392 [Terfezia boudieri ATCC MYA-4762]|uniref:Uncharacterized protein n=1 Tax=Terfezia boudieri ATCC MYA-4762 TaxID=1051890 RepID=A0A3N4LQI8_9PEZI|nr:hypothetical protein L211DRAFT_838392 [Terfezia boudieri ATCC MYA-4762]
MFLRNHLHILSRLWFAILDKLARIPELVFESSPFLFIILNTIERLPSSSFSSHLLEMVGETSPQGASTPQQQPSYQLSSLDNLHALCLPCWYLNLLSPRAPFSLRAPFSMAPSISSSEATLNTLMPRRPHNPLLHGTIFSSNAQPVAPPLRGHKLWHLNLPPQVVRDTINSVLGTTCGALNLLLCSAPDVRSRCYDDITTSTGSS